MALGYGRPSSLENYTHIYSGDPAIDRDAEGFDFEKWTDSGEDEFLPLKPDQEPTRFEMRHLSSKELALLMDILNKEGAARASHEACRRAVVSISDLDAKLEREGGCSVLPEDVMAVLWSAAEGHGVVVGELGNRAFLESSPKKK